MHAERAGGTFPPAVVLEEHLEGTREHPEAAMVPVPNALPAGGCSFHNGHTVHGAGANMTPGRRRAMTAAFMPSGARFNGHRDVGVLREGYLDILLPRDPLDNDELVPLITRLPAPAPIN